MPVLESEVSTKLLALANVGFAPTNKVPEKTGPPDVTSDLTVNRIFSSQMLGPLANAVLAAPAARPGQLKDRYLQRKAAAAYCAQHSKQAEAGVPNHFALPQQQKQVVD